MAGVINSCFLYFLFYFLNCRLFLLKIFIHNYCSFPNNYISSSKLVIFPVLLWFLWILLYISIWIRLLLFSKHLMMIFHIFPTIFISHTFYFFQFYKLQYFCHIFFLINWFQYLLLYWQVHYWWTIPIYFLIIRSW